MAKQKQFKVWLYEFHHGLKNRFGLDPSDAHLAEDQIMGLFIEGCDPDGLLEMVKEKYSLMEIDE